MLKTIIGFDKHAVFVALSAQTDKQATTKITTPTDYRAKQMKPKNYKRGYPVAVLVGIEQGHAALWQIFSQVAKHQQTIPLNGDIKDQKALYSFYETIINALRPVLKEGVRSIIVASPPRTSYAQGFLSHIKVHHSWLFQSKDKAAFNLIVGSASSPTQVATLTKTASFKQLINKTTAQETENLLEILEKLLSQTDNLVGYSLQEAENLILFEQPKGKPQPEYLLITTEYLASSRQKNRVHRLMQIAQNKKVKTRVIDSESAAGERLTQFGGIVCLAKIG
jgi:stalled ribosome rescue protein Dom34